MRSRILLVSGLLALVCSVFLVPAASAAGEARVRVVHASPNTPAVDVYVDGAKTLSAVTFFSASPYLSVPAGNRRIQVTPAGQPAASGPIDQTVSVNADTAYTIAAVGLLGGAGGQALRPVPSIDDLSGPATGKAKIRVYHFSPDTPAVGVRVVGGSILVSTLDFPNASSYVEVDPGTYNLEVFVAPAGPVALTLPNVVLKAGTIYEFAAVGQSTASPSTLKVKTITTSATARVRVVHASPNTPAVDVYVDGARALANVSFFAASRYLDVPAGNRRIQVTPAGQPAASGPIDQTVTVETGKAYTIAAVGLLSGTGVQVLQAVLLSDDLSAPTAGQARLRVYHFSPDAPAVGVRVAGGPTLIPSLAFPNVSDYLSVSDGTYTLEVFAAPGGAVVLTIPGFRAIGGQIYDLFAVGLAAANPSTLRIETAATSATARVRAVHASPDAPAVDIFVNGTKTLQGVPFFTAGSYLTLPAGSYLIQIAPTGLPAANAVISETIAIETGRAYTVAATGLLNPPTGGAPLGATVIQDNLSAPAPGKARIRVLHFSPDAPAVGLRLAGGADLFTNLTFPNASDYREVDPGVLDLEVFAQSSGTTVRSLEDVTIESGRICDFFANDRLAALKITRVCYGPNGTPLVWLPTLRNNG